MWWPRHAAPGAPGRPSRRRAGLAAVAVSLALVPALAGCGFQPMYARPAAGTAGPSGEMAAIRILPLPDQIGQQMHNLLRDRLNPNGQPRRPAYLLRVRLSEAREELGIRKDETATRANLTVRASFELSDAPTGKVLVAGDASSTNSYNILENQFATIFSESDARERALRELSDSIRTRLAIYFSRARETAS